MASVSKVQFKLTSILTYTTLRLVRDSDEMSRQMRWHVETMSADGANPIETMASK